MKIPHFITNAVETLIIFVLVGLGTTFCLSGGQMTLNDAYVAGVAAAGSWYTSNSAYLKGQFRTLFPEWSSPLAATTLVPTTVAVVTPPATDPASSVAYMPESNQPPTQ